MKDDHPVSTDCDNQIKKSNPSNSVKDKKTVVENKTDDSDSSICSSDFSFSDEETKEEKKSYKENRLKMIKLYGLDKEKKHFPTDNKMSSRVKYYTFNIKRKQREELPLRGWHNLKLYKNDQFLDDWVNEPDEVSTMNIDRIHVNDITVEEFMDKYEIPGVPVVLLG